jgi:hypothetical protein
MKGFLHIILFLLGIQSAVFSQLSPGDLSTAHANLEGMSNCTKCHELGDKVTNAKCLDCHKEIKALLTQKRGYHSSAEVQRKNCFECHGEHNGRKFQLIRFNEEQFDHNLANYPLEGKHKVIDCRQCHTSENIVEPELKKKKSTFLGLSQKCISCHDDYHQETLSNDCKKCHDTEKFRPAPNFRHDQAKYALAGKHEEVDCVKCHPMEQVSGKETQKFTGLQFSDCISCHKDPHVGNLQGSCKTCHSENGFSPFIGKKRFNHNLTNFTLKGKHQSVDCFICHTPTSDAQLVFQDKVGITVNQCAKCHDDQHEGRFGTDCATCHTEKGFKGISSLKSMDNFNHALTNFPLEGLHAKVDCKKCHAESYSAPIAHSKCNSCHEDYHEGTFVTNGQATDCKECHSVVFGFAPSTYSLEQHQKNSFPLEGAHQATPCIACHVKEDKWEFRTIGNRCTDCHIDQHEGQFVQENETDCKRCHDSEDWFPRKFDHNSTRFPLDGKHATVECKKCHLPEQQGGKEVVIYKNNKTKCIDCHS